MARKIIFPIKIEDKSFSNVEELYNYYYAVEPEELTDFSKPFWNEGINLTELVHFPERFTLINQYLKTETK